jgi:hypothetical protein
MEAPLNEAPKTLPRVKECYHCGSPEGEERCTSKVHCDICAETHYNLQLLYLRNKEEIGIS